MKKKQSFVLLEIMIAIALVASVLLPFFHYPFEHMQHELKALFEMELERVAQNKLVDLQTRVWKKEISEERIFSDKQFKDPLETKIFTLELSPTLNRQYEEKAYVTWEKQKLSDDRTISALIHFKVEYKLPNKRNKILVAESSTVAQKKI
ncbi:MAG: type II secretion system protein [Simkaniaceae bacterium]|nr:type II secretion system protein [Candidatus Sacchlamyda saccharinae]